MNRINIAGDFYVPYIKGLKFGDELKNLLDSGDINIVNMEAPINTPKSKPIKKSGPNLQQDSYVPKFLEENGFNAISLANNHAMDYGEMALDATLQAFSKAKVFGAGTFDQAYNVIYLPVSNKRIGILGISQYEFGMHDEETYTKEKLGIAWMGHPCIDKLIIDSKQKCDFLIILPHAGLENFEYPLPEVCTLYRHFVEMGADAVVGGHPHIPQCIETYKGKPIIYSLGNFCFDTPYKGNPMWNEGLIVTIDINESRNASVTIRSTQFNQSTHIVEIPSNQKMVTFLQDINTVFHDKNNYHNVINSRCLELAPYYTSLFELSGLFQLNIKRCVKHLLVSIRNFILNKKNPTINDSHFINNIRCETHRWIISRIYELKSYTLKEI